jgi:hypothetical protein
MAGRPDGWAFGWLSDYVAGLPENREAGLLLGGWMAGRLGGLTTARFDYRTTGRLGADALRLNGWAAG